MNDPIKFVKGAVAKKDFVPNLTHFEIKNGYIKGYNGELALCAPIDCDLDVMPKADQFIKAVSRCEDDIKLSLTKNGKLALKSGRLRILVECSSFGEFPNVEPEGEPLELEGSLLKCLKVLEPLIATDASKPWANGILLSSHSAYATNNVILAEYWLGYNCPTPINIPASAIKEILRIGEEPVSMSHTSGKLTLYYESGAWLSTSLLSLEWPNVGKLLDKVSEAPKLPEGFFEAVETIKPFSNELDKVYFLGDKLCTSNETENAACTLDLSGVNLLGCYACEQLLKLRKIVHSVNLNAYPQAASFHGENLRGLIVGFCK